MSLILKRNFCFDVNGRSPPCSRLMCGLWKSTQHLPIYYSKVTLRYDKEIKGSWILLGNRWIWGIYCNWEALKISDRATHSELASKSKTEERFTRKWRIGLFRFTNYKRNISNFTKPDLSARVHLKYGSHVQGFCTLRTFARYVRNSSFQCTRTRWESTMSGKGFWRVTKRLSRQWMTKKSLC